MRLGEVLRDSIRSRGWEQRLREEDVIARWGEAVGARIAAHARPSGIAGRRLTVVTASPVWTQQLALLKPDILRRIARRFGPGVVTELFFVTGEIPPPEAPAAPESPAPGPAAEVPADLDRDFADIADEQLRDALRRACRAALGRSEGPPEP